MAKRKKGRELDGLLLLDKKLGISSNKALQNIKFLFEAQKAGHTGSLDPLATGLLPICFGEATKFSQFLLDADKIYLARIKLGERTSTADAEGEILEQRPCDFAFEVLVEVLSQFTGELKQIPSMYSALKHEGQPLYKLARQGKEVERKARNIFIHELRLLSERQLFEQQHTIEVYVHCSKGTYIRNLAEDIGEQAGCGAHLQGLRRVGIGHFTEMHTEQSLIELKASQGMQAMDSMLLPIDELLVNFPKLILSSEQAWAIKQGQHLDARQGQWNLDAPEDVDLFRLYTQDQTEQLSFLGLAYLTEDCLLAPKRLLKTN